MSSVESTNPENHSSRRKFLQHSSAAAVGGSIAASLGAIPAVHAQGSEAVNVALIGCGGCGSGAALNAMKADPNNRRTVMCDLFPDRLAQARKRLTPELGQQMRVTDDTAFSGFDGYKRVMESDAKVVLLCTTPHFRPLHLKAAIDAGKHVFCEKPVAVDAPGVRGVLETAKKAKEKNLTLVSGLCYRYDQAKQEVVKRIHDGELGDIQFLQTNYLTGWLWSNPRKPDWGDLEWQLRNWLYFYWLSGDHIVEQHIHSIDKMLWV